MPVITGKRLSDRTIYSFVIDHHPRFAYQAWHLARSILQHCGARPQDIHAHLTGRVPATVRESFAAEGYTIHGLEPFGDGRWCNKAAQLESLLDLDFDIAVLLDTDIVLIDDIAPFLGSDAVQGKIVDVCNPSLTAHREIFTNAGAIDLPEMVAVDSPPGETFMGNANGGVYVVPKGLAPSFSTAWRQWVTWLLSNDEPLRREGTALHIDQVAVSLAIHLSKIPFRPLCANANYFVHFAADHHYLDTARPIAALHYHAEAMNVLGLIQSQAELQRFELEAIERANNQIGASFNNRLFWSYRYACHPERGSGLGSRGDNLAYKRSLLKKHGIEEASSILDVGCGDLEVVRELDLNGYLGIDVSSEAIDKAHLAKPGWNFEVYAGQDIAARDTVLCFEVLIHQRTLDDYRTLIGFISDHANKTLFVSGYDSKDAPNHMVYFHEPLLFSLEQTGRFATIEAIGAHTDVTIYRCEVSGEGRVEPAVAMQT